MNKNKICKKNRNHYIDDWGCVDCMFEEIAKRGLKEEEKKND